jgi:hypothetical protein
MNRRCRDLETLTCVEKFQIRLECVKLWSGELGVVDWERAVSGWLLWWVQPQAVGYVLRGTEDPVFSVG